MNSLLDNFQQMNGETSNTTIRGHKTASIIENKNKKKRKKGTRIAHLLKGHKEIL